MDTGNTYWSVVTVDDSNVVHKSGNEIVSGEKVFDGTRVFIRNNELVKAQTPTDGDKYITLHLVDKNNNRVGALEYFQRSTGSNDIKLVCWDKNSPEEDYVWSAIYIGFDAVTSATPIPYFEAPSTSALRNNGADVLTRDWIPKDTRIVHIAGDETITGSKQFDSAVICTAPWINPLRFKDSRVEKGATLSESAYQGMVWLDKNNEWISAIYRRSNKDSNTHDLCFNAYQNTVGGSDAQMYLRRYTNGDSLFVVPNILLLNSHVFRYGTTGRTYFCGGSTTDHIGNDDVSSALILYGKDWDGTNNGGRFCLGAATSSSNKKQFWGGPDGTLTWNGQPLQVSSDERLKTPISSVPDDVLDIWGKVDWGQFKFLSSVEKKGNDARFHLGLIAQKVKSVFESNGFDGCSYGILCHEYREAKDWDQEEIDREAWVDENGTEHPAVKKLQHYHEDGVDLWMVRYTEALCMEAAYNRRRVSRVEERLLALEQELAELKNSAA